MTNIMVKEGYYMAKNKKAKNKALPKADVEFAQENANGLEKKALNAQRDVNK
jgi:hypothetical protein